MQRSTRSSEQTTSQTPDFESPSFKTHPHAHCLIHWEIEVRQPDEKRGEDGVEQPSNGERVVPRDDLLGRREEARLSIRVG